MRKIVQGVLEWFQVDQAVFWGLFARAWQFTAGPVTLVLVAQSLSPEEQGFYYTFGSLLGLQSFVELGFSIVIINLASHEWANLSLGKTGRITGDSSALSRLVSLGRLVFRWYAVASIIFVTCVGMIGYLFLSRTASTGIDWSYAWFTLVILTGLILCGLPFNSILEGCNQVSTINRFRLTQAIFSSIALWGTLIFGGGLWAAAASAGVSLMRDFYLVAVQYRHFFEPFLKAPAGARFHWVTEILPMQWRLALAGFVNYFAFSLFNPIMFHYHGATVAGRMGMTWQVVSGIQSVALTWIQSNVPRFGILIAKKEYEELDRVWLKISSMSLIFLGGVATLVWTLVYGLNVFEIPIAERLLDPLPTALLLGAAVFIQVSQCLSAYLRAHKREVLTVMSVTSSLLIGSAVWWLGSYMGPIGAAAGYALVVAGYMVPYQLLIWFKFRSLWHRS